ncbi:MAG: histidine kinase [Ferruginibacter sp.]|nr:histidine kinase [Ferruginibacter sp.]
MVKYKNIYYFVNRMKIKLPQYSGKDYLVMLGIVPGFTLFINYNIFGNEYFSDTGLLATATLITCAGFCLDFIFCGWIAVAMKNRFPKERELMKRLTLMILTFLLITGLFLYSLFEVYGYFTFFNYRINEAGFIWSYISMGLINVFLTFLMEGISRYQIWKANCEQTEQLKKVYKERKLQGLNSHLNQHFLFECLDSLSGLIQQEGDNAEKFLDEMSKVYRYMLRIDEEKLVTLEAELKFIESYRHLLKARYGEGLQLEVDISGSHKNKLLPPLSLQVIVENTFSLNDISDTSPLKISICSADNNVVKISNNVQPKYTEPAMDHQVSLSNLANNYRLLINSPMIIDDLGGYRVIHLPLIIKEGKEEEMV